MGAACAIGMLLATGCSSDSSSSSSDGGSLDLDFGDFIGADSEAIRTVKDGIIKACPLSTIEEMADSFLTNPQWSEFTSTTGNTVVELEGGLIYDNLPTQAVIQFTVIPSVGSFEAEYLEIGGAPQSLLVMSALFNKMCSAT